MTAKIARLTFVKMLLSVFVATVFFAASPQLNAERPDDILIIANKKLNASSISKEELRAIFLKKKETINGTKVIPLNAKSPKTTREAFRGRIIGMTEAEETAYWEELKIKKAVQAPAEFSNTLRAVFSVANSISYCERSQYKDGVAKIIAVF